MITDRRAFERWDERERRAALSAMTIADSIAVAESLLTSDAMRVARFPEWPPPVSLAIALGIRQAPR